jgi:hypothetical protein
MWIRFAVMAISERIGQVASAYLVRERGEARGEIGFKVPAIAHSAAPGGDWKGHDE